MTNNPQNPPNPQNVQPQRPQYYASPSQMNPPGYNQQTNYNPRQRASTINAGAGPTIGAQIGAQIGPRGIPSQRNAPLQNTRSTPGIAPNTINGFQAQPPNINQYPGQPRPAQVQVPNHFNQVRSYTQPSPTQFNPQQINPNNPLQINQINRSQISPFNSSQINRPQINQINPPQINQPQINQPQINSPQINSTQINPPQINPPQINSPQINPPQINSSQINPPQITSPQINPAQINPPQINPAQINPPQINPAQINPAQINPPQINPTQINPTQINPPQINSPQINSPQINPPQINPPQINPPQIHSPQINPPQINPPQINPPQINPPQINSPQINPPQINPPQINPPQINPPQINPPQINPPQINPPQINQQPSQGYPNKNTVNQSQRPSPSQNIPGLPRNSMKTSSNPSIPHSANSQFNQPNASNQLQQNELRSSQDPPLYRPNSNVNISGQPLHQSQTPQQQQIFIRPTQQTSPIQQPQQLQQPQQPQQSKQVPQFANLQQQMQYEFRMKQEEEKRKLLQLQQEKQLALQQKRNLYQKQQEEKEKLEAQQRLLEEQQQYQQQLIQNKIAQTNDNYLQEQHQRLHLSNGNQAPSSQTQQFQPIQSPKSEPIAHHLAPQLQPQQISTPYQSQQQQIHPQQDSISQPSISQSQPQSEPISQHTTPQLQPPLQLEPLVPLTQQQPPLQLEPLVPLTQQQPPLQIEPLVPPTQQQPLQLEPLVPLTQQQPPLQIEPLIPPTQQQPLQIEPLIQPTQQQQSPLQIESLVPPTQQQSPMQIEPLASPIQQQSPLQIEPLVPPQQQSPFQIEPLTPPAQQQSPIQGEPSTQPTQQQQFGLNQNMPFGGNINNIPLNTENGINTTNSFNFTPVLEQTTRNDDTSTGTVDFNEDLSGDEDENGQPSEITPINGFRAHRSHTYAPNVNAPNLSSINGDSTHKITFDGSKFPRFLGRRETIMLQQGTRKRRNSSFKTCLVPEIIEKDKVTINGQIQNLLDDPQSGMSNFTWSKQYVVDCTEEENPYIDPKAISLSMQKAGGSNNVVRLFSEKVRPIHFQKVDETPPLAPSTESANIPMLSDVTDKTKPPIIPNVDQKDLPNAADCFFRKAPPPGLLFTIEDMPIAGLSKRKFACLRSRDVKTDFELIEPLFFGAFIIQDGTIISEQWSFTSKGCSQFIPDISLSPKVSLQLPLTYENTFFCVVVSRFLLPENGATVNKYYAKPSAKTLQAARAQAINYNKFVGVYAPFALTYVDLKTVLENKYFDMPPPFAISQPLRVVLKQIKPGQKLSENTYPIYLIFDSNIVEASNIQDVLADNSLFVRLAGPLPLAPCYNFRHRLLVRLNQVNLHTTSRNIFAELKVKSELGELPIFSTPYSTQKAKTVFTRCWYHEKKPYFDELFIIDLPLPLPKTLSLVITFFNAALKNVGLKGTDPKEMIGMCTIPLLEDGNRFLSDGEHQYPVEYKGQPAISTPAFNISSLLDSSLISTDNNLNVFYSSVDSQVLERCSEREVTINMFSIIDQIVNEMMNKGVECIKSLAILTKKKVNLDWKIIENCLNDYAIYFAFRNEDTCSPEFHRSLLSSWAEFMKTNPDSNRTDSRIIPFLFNMIIKSLYITKDQDFSNNFSTFITQWSKLLDAQQIGEYARFLNLLFDVGCYYYAVIAIECQMANLLNITSKHQILIEFLSQVFRPKLFYSALVYVDRLKMNIIDMIKYSKRPDCTTLQFIYRTFLRLFAQYSAEMKQKIAERLINSLEILSPFETVHFIENDGNHPVIYYYCFILSCVSYEAFSNWFSHQVDHFKDFFKTLHFIIGKMQDIELRRVAYFAVLHILSFIAQMKDLEGIIEATNIIYHFLCVDLPLDFICPLIRTLSQLIEENYTVLIAYSNPALTRHLVKILELSYLVPEEVSNLFKVLYETDIKNFGNTLRSQAICYRAVHSLKSLDFIKIIPEYQLPISSIIFELQRIQQLTKSQLSEEKLTEVMQMKAKMMFSSPDATIECLNELVEYHRSHEYFAEEIQTLLLQASIIIEFLVAQQKMDISYLNIMPPSKLFSDLCPICEHFRCPEGGDFIAKSYCDSPMFSERSLINHLIFIIERSQETKYHELGYLLIDRIWPILEHRRFYTLLTNTFTRFGDCYKALSDIPSDEDRLFGHYFRICFYGSVFREENGKIFIYREKKLTHLFELTNRLVNYYTEICKPTQIELIKESGGVDISKLDPSKGYIQITFVEPYFAKKENYARITPFERSHVLDAFYFDTPFTKGGNKAQASIDQQWVRRTVLTVELPMPSIIKRINVTLSKEIEFAPIRVAYRQIRDRINLLKNAIERSDYRAIQQLLHGSLLVQVNEGPSRMAEVFLGETSDDDKALDMNYNKYKDKLKAAFKEFLIINQKGIDVHGKYVEDHPVFAPLQHELESGFSALQEKISNYVQI